MCSVEAIKPTGQADGDAAHKLRVRVMREIANAGAVQTSLRCANIPMLFTESDTAPDACECEWLRACESSAVSALPQSRSLRRLPDETLCMPHVCNVVCMYSLCCSHAVWGARGASIHVHEDARSLLPH